MAAAVVVAAATVHAGLMWQVIFEERSHRSSNASDLLPPGTEVGPMLCLWSFSPMSACFVLLPSQAFGGPQCQPQSCN